MTNQPGNGRVLVTGASGVLGHALIEELRTGSDREIIGLSSQDVNLIDFEATAAYFQRIRPTIIYHLAARVYGIMGNLRMQGSSYLDNIRINTNVVEAARLCGAEKIVAAGSTAIYSDKVALPMREEDIWSDAPHGSEAGYAHAKRSMLAQLDAYRDQYGLDYAFCVCTNLYGPHDKFDEENGHVLPSLIAKFHRGLRDGQPVTIWGSGKPLRDFLYSKDPALAMRLSGERFSGPINIATGTNISIEQVGNLIKKVSGFQGEIVWDRSRPDGQKLRAYDISKLRNLGFAPKYSLEQGLVETFAWFDRNVEQVRR